MLFQHGEQAENQWREHIKQCEFPANQYEYCKYNKSIKGGHEEA